MSFPLTIGPLPLDSQVVLAPLAGISDLAFRLLCRRFGAALVFSEMISCHGLVRNQPNTRRLLATHADEHPVAFQLFGADPQVMAAASVLLAEAGADIVDLNFGCPVPKVVRHKGGSALLKEPDQLQAIVTACVRVCPCPVTVKIRAGWAENEINAKEIARRVEDAGAAAITVHARTRSQKFSSPANWSIIADVVQTVRIPVLGNGDVWQGADAQRLLQQTGCAGVMVGRGALGRPWIFHHIQHFLTTQEILPEPLLVEKVALIYEHYFSLKQLKGERTALREMRKHTTWYLRGLPHGAEIRSQINRCGSENEFRQILKQVETQRLA